MDHTVLLDTYSSHTYPRMLLLFIHSNLIAGSKPMQWNTMEKHIYSKN